MTDSEVKKKVEPSLEAIVAVGRAGGRREGGQRRRSEPARLQPQGSGKTTLGGRRQAGVRRSPRRATRAFTPVSMASGTRGTAAPVDRATARSNPPGRARFARSRRRSAVKIRSIGAFQSRGIRRAGEAPWPPRAREGRGRRSGHVRDALRARTLTLRKWVKVQMCGNEWLSGATWARGSAFFPVVPHSTSNLV